VRSSETSFVTPGALEGVAGAAFFYPSAGDDWDDPLRLFVPLITEFWFVDIAYFTGESADRAKPLLADLPLWAFQGFTLDGPPVAARERRVDAFGNEYPYVEPCTRSEVYRHQPSGTCVTIHRRRGYGQRSISLVPDIGVFFHRGDSPGEGGSNVYWLSKRWFPEVRSRLREGGLVVTHGSLAHVKPLRRLARRNPSRKDAYLGAIHFDKWSRRWTWVGWVGERATPIWRLTSDIA
jgi:hypothetical protein